MFALGAGIGLVTMSVSVSLSLLVPLVAKNVVRREFILPYIMGANITTLGDTLLAAFALDSAASVRVLLAALLAATAVSLVVLAFVYRPVWTTLWDVQTAVTASRARLALFTAGVLLLPVLAIAAAAVLG
jgi:Na+/phosphate symporter